MAEHGTHARYSTGACRCWPCRYAHYEYNQNRVKQIAYGRWPGMVDAGPVRDHVRSLMAHNIGWRRVAAEAGVATGTVARLLYGNGNNRTLTARLRADTAAALMAVTPSLDAVGSTTAMDATGTRRRLQALVSIGWSQAKLAARAGFAPTNIGRLLSSERVTAATARTVRDLYDQMWDAAPPEEEWRDKIAANRARGYAAERGWAPPMAWDDDSIDDPAAVPDGAGSVPVRLPQGPELLWLVDELRETYEAIAQRFGAHVKTVRSAVSRARQGVRA